MDEKEDLWDCFLKRFFKFRVPSVPLFVCWKVLFPACLAIGNRQMKSGARLITLKGLIPRYYFLDIII